MSDVLDIPVLVLNKHYQAVGLVTARRAMVLLFGATARALDDDAEAHDWASWSALNVRNEDDFIGLVHGKVRVPRVVQLIRYARMPRTGVRLSRQNVFLRDEFRCQYCRTVFTPSQLNLDHVLPRSRGGPTSWENIVTSCHPCNRRKGRALPEECGMPLYKKPQRPSLSTIPSLHGVVRRYPQWAPFLGG